MKNQALVSMSTICLFDPHTLPFINILIFFTLYLMTSQQTGNLEHSRKVLVWFNFPDEYARLTESPPAPLPPLVVVVVQ